MELCWEKKIGCLVDQRSKIIDFLSYTILQKFELISTFVFRVHIYFYIKQSKWYVRCFPRLYLSLYTWYIPSSQFCPFRASIRSSSCDPSQPSSVSFAPSQLSSTLFSIPPHFLNQFLQGACRGVLWMDSLCCSQNMSSLVYLHGTWDGGCWC